jgi:hypothetical protein
MLPGPLVQPESGRAFYPNGFIDGDTLKVGYTTGNNSMYSGILPQLPDFSRPFLLPRAGRPGLKIENGKAILTQASSSLGLVLTPELTRKENLSLQFEFKADLLYVHNYWTVLTLGGKTRDGLRLVIQVQESGNAFKMGCAKSALAVYTSLPQIRRSFSPRRIWKSRFPASTSVRLSLLCNKCPLIAIYGRVK